jgi:hypothetical protein
MSAYRKAATVSRSIPGTTEGVVAPRSSNEEGYITPALRSYPLIAASLLELFLQENLTPQLQQTACWKLFQLIPVVRSIQMSKRPINECTDGDMVTLITTVQQIMTGLQTADTEEGRSAVIMRAVYGLVLRNMGHNPTHPIVQHSQYLSLSDHSSSLTGGNRTNHQQLSRQLDIGQHRARCLDLTGRPRESAAMHPEDGGSKVLRNVGTLPQY